MSDGQPKPGEAGASGSPGPGAGPLADPRRRDVGEAGHTRKRIVTHGVPAEEAEAAAVLIHGRGGSPEGMLTLADRVAVEGLAWIAPCADGKTWYPKSFLEPLEENEPWLSSALAWLEEIVSDLDEKGISPENVGFVGFSQGACLSSEFVARHPRRYGGVAALSGGLVGPPESDFAARFGLPDTAMAGKEGVGASPSRGALSDTPIFLGCSDVDPHIPEERVHESAEILEALGADVTVRIYPGMGHTVNDDEMDRVELLLEGLA